MGHAKFVASDKGPVVDVGGKLYTAKHISIATGGRPIVPAVPGRVYCPLVILRCVAS